MVSLLCLAAAKANAAAGDLDVTFNRNYPDSSRVETTVLQVDSKILIGGFFSTVGGVTRHYLARLNADGSLDTSFNPNPDSYVYCISVQADGKIIIGGFFTTVSGVARNRIVRLNANGSLDTSFNPNANESVLSTAIQTDGKILIGGTFTSVGGISRNRIARLNVDGSVDLSFNPDTNNTVNSIFQTEGKIHIVGDFTSVGGVTRNRIALLNDNGSLDATYNPNANNSVRTATLQTDGKILIGGDFTSVSSVTCNRIARLNSNGSLDTIFNPNANNTVISMAVQVDGKIVVAGDFTNMGGVTRNSMARLNANGTLDTTFDPNVASLYVSSATLQADGKILVGGSYETVGGVLAMSISRLDNDPATQTLSVTNSNRIEWLRGGSSPEVFNVTFELSTNGGNSYTPLGTGLRITGGWELNGLSLPATGQLRVRGQLAAGQNKGGLIESEVSFSSAPSSNLPTDIALSATSLNENNAPNAPIGTLSATDTDVGDSHSFNLVYGIGSTDNPYFSIVGNTLKLTKFADFESKRFYSIRLRATDNGGLFFEKACIITVTNVIEAGDVDDTLNSNVNDFVASMAMQGDGRLLIGGSFTNIGGVTRNRIARFNANGSLDTAFDPNANNSVSCIAVQADGKILIGGNFTSVGGNTKQRIARLNFDGSPDLTFTAGANGSVGSIAIQSDGSILIGGFFTTVSGVSHRYIARLNSDGSLDSTFNPVASNFVRSTTLQADGRILIGGNFTTVNGTFRNCLARLNTDGSLDNTFSGYTDSSVQCIVVQPDGKIVLAGDFYSVNDITRNHMARINANGTLDTSFSPSVAGPLLSVVSDSSSVYGLSLQTDGKIILGGDFASVSGVTRTRIARVNSDGSLDTTFNTNTDVYLTNYITDTTIQADGKIIIGGSFTQVDGVTRNRLARLENNPASQNLSAITNNSIRWLRSGSSSEVSHVTFELSTNGGSSYTMLGSGTRIAGGWQLTGLNLPPNGQLRAQGKAMGGASSSLIESVQSFAFTAPTDISLSSTSIAENNPVVSIVGTLSATDADVGDIHTFSLVSGIGSTDNDSFTVTGNSLKINGSANYEVRKSYDIRLRTIDSFGLSFEKAFTISIINLNDTPSDAWREAYFGSPDDTGDSADTADPDGDGIPNLMEFAFGTDPASNGSGGAVLHYTGTFAEGGTLTSNGLPITLIENIATGADFRAVFCRYKNYQNAGLTYTPQFSADLITWENSTATPTVLADNGTYQIVSVKYARAMSDGQKARFFRISISH